MAMVSCLAITLEVQQSVWRAVSITDVPVERDLGRMWRYDSREPAAVRAFLEVLHAQAPPGKARETCPGARMPCTPGWRVERSGPRCRLYFGRCLC